MDEHPFIELIEKHDAAVNRVCRSFCRDAEDREDLRQEILMHLWTGWKDYRPDHKPITWVYRVAVNTAISWRRHRLKQVDTCSFDGFDLPEDTVLREQATHLKSNEIQATTSTPGIYCNSQCDPDDVMALIDNNIKHIKEIQKL